MPNPKGHMFNYEYEGKHVSALHRFTERISDSIARSLSARVGYPVDLWYSFRDTRYDVYTAKWFDGNIFQEAKIWVQQ